MIPAGAPTGKDGPHVFVEDLARPELAPHDRAHLEKSLRLRVGDELTASDGRGRWRPCRFGEPLEVAGPVVEVASPSPRLTIAMAVVKGDRQDGVVQKLTELGIDEIVPFFAERSVVAWDAARAEKQLARWRRIARESSMQSRRVRLPTIAAPTTFEALSGDDPVAVRAERGGQALRPDHTTVLVGPEGGWSDAERAALGEVSLGSNVLRADTAAIAAGTLAAALRSGLVVSA